MGAGDYEAPIVGGRVVPSPLASSLLLEGHQSVDSRAFLLGEGNTSRAELPLMSGSVSCDPTSTVRRSGDVTVLARWPTSPTSRLTPYGSRVCVQRGIRVAIDAIEWMTLMTGPVWETSQTDDDVDSVELKLSLKDEMAVLAADRFDENTATDPTLTVLEQLTRIIRRTLPVADIVDLSGAAGQALVGKLDMQKDPAAGIAKIAEACGLEVLTGRGYQQFVIRPVPSLDDPPRWMVAEGAAGNILTVERKRTREKVYNRVVATGESNAGTGSAATVPPSGEARISDATDPLVYGGPAGRVTRFLSSPLIKTNEQAAAAAAGLLARLRGGNLETSFTTLVNPALDGGDVILADLASGRSRHITGTVTLPLSEGDSQSVPTRGIDLPDETASAT